MAKKSLMEYINNTKKKEEAGVASSSAKNTNLGQGKKDLRAYINQTSDSASDTWMKAVDTQTSELPKLLNQGVGRDLNRLNNITSYSERVNSLLQNGTRALQAAKGTKKYDTVKQYMSYLNDLKSGIDFYKSGNDIRNITQQQYENDKAQNYNGLNNLEYGSKTPSQNWMDTKNRENYNRNMFGKYGNMTYEELESAQRANNRAKNDSNRESLQKENDWIESYKMNMASDEDINSAYKRAQENNKELAKQKSYLEAQRANSTLSNDERQKYQDEINVIDQEMTYNEQLINDYADYVMYGKSNMQQWASEVDGMTYEEMQNYIAGINDNTHKREYETAIANMEGGKEYLEWAKQTGRDITPEDFESYIDRNNIANLDDDTYLKLQELKSKSDSFVAPELKTEYLKRYADENIDTYEDYQAKYDELQVEYDKLGGLDGADVATEYQTKYKEGYLATKQEYNYNMLSEIDKELLKQAVQENSQSKINDITTKLINSGYSEAEVDSIVSYAQARENAKIAESKNEELREYGEKHPVLGTIRSVPYSLMSGVGMVSAIGNELKNSFGGETPIDYNAPEYRYSQNSEALRMGAKERIDSDVGKFVYDAVSSTLDSMAVAPLGLLGGGGSAVASVILGSSAGTHAMMNAKERGLNNQQALGSAMSSAIFETLFEKVSLDKLINTATTSTSLKKLAKNVITSMGIEASEETLTEVANIAYDVIANADKSEYKISIENYMRMGYSRAEAEKKAQSELALRVGQSAVGGAIGGLMFGAVGGVVNYTSSRINNGNQTEVEYSPEAQTDETIQEEIQNNYEAENLPVNVSENDVIEENFENIAEDTAEDVQMDEAIEMLTRGNTDNALMRIAEQVNGVEDTNNVENINEVQTSNEATEEVVPQSTETDIPDAIKLADEEITERVSNGSYKPKYELGTSITTEVGLGYVQEIIKTSGETMDLIVNYEDGHSEVVKFENVEDYENLEDDNHAYLYQSASVVGYNGANELVKAVDDNLMENTNALIKFTDDFYRIYNAGNKGTSFDDVYGSGIGLRMPERLAYRFYNAGAKDARLKEYKKPAEAKTQYRNEKNVPEANYKDFNVKKNWNRLTNRQRNEIEVVNKISEATGVTIKFYESKPGADGKYTAANGFYNPKTNEIWIDINAGKNSIHVGRTALLRTLSHEMTHYIRNWSQSKYLELEEFVLDKLTKETGKSVDVLVNEKAEKLNLSEDIAREEVIADACEMMLKDSKAIEQLAAENKTLYDKIKEWITEYIVKIKEAFEGVYATSKEARAMMKYADELQELWDSALMKKKSTKKINEKSDSEIRYALRSKDELIELAQAVYNREGIKFDKYYSLGTIPRLYYDVLGIEEFNLVMAPNHAYENMATEEMAESDNVYNKRANYHELGPIKWVRLLRKISDPIAIYENNRISTNPRIAIELTEKWSAIIELYSNAITADGSSRDNHATVTIFPVESENYYDEFVCLYKKDSFQTEVTEVISPGIVNETNLYKENIQQFREKINEFLENQNKKRKNKNADVNKNARNNPDIRYQSRNNTDSDGNVLTEAQQEHHKESQVRDENGNLMVMYHGTPQGGFTVFKNDLTFFTSNKEYADVYQSASASSRNSRKNESSPETYEVYLNIKKPFDTRDKKTKDIFVNEYVKGGWALGIDPYTEYKDTTSTGLPSWEEADNIYEFLEENDMLDDYDGIVIDEGGIPGENGEVISRGIAYVTFNPNQIKSVTNENPTDDPDIRLSVRDASNEDYESIIEENEQLKKQVELLEQQFKVTNGHAPKMEDVLKVGRKILKEYSSKYDLNTFADNMKEIIEYTRNHKFQNYNAVMDAMMKMAEEIARKSEYLDTSMYDQYAQLRKTLRTTTIRLTDTQLQEIAYNYDSFDTFRKRFFGRFRFSKTKGFYLDELWGQYAEMYPEMFMADTNEGDMVNELIDIYEQIKSPVIIKQSEVEIQQAAVDIAQEIFSEYFALPSVQTFADARISDLKKAREEYNQMRYESKQAYKEKYNKKVYRDKIKRLRNNLAAKVTQKKSVPFEMVDRVIAVCNEIYLGGVNIEHAVRKTAAELNDQKDNFNLTEAQANTIAEKCSIMFLENSKESVGRTEERFIKWLEENKYGGTQFRQIANICHDNFFAIAASSKVEKGLHGRLKNLQQSYAEFEKNAEYEWQAEYDERLNDQLKIIADAVQDKAINALNIHELERVYNALKEVSHMVVNATMQIADEKGRTNLEVGEQIIQEVSKITREEKGALKKLAKKVNVYAEKYMLNSVRYIKAITGYNPNSVLYKLYESLFVATRRYNKFVMESKKQFDELLENKKEYNLFTGKNEKGLVKDVLFDKKGNQITLTHSMIVQIIMTWERSQGKVHMEKGGMTIYSVEHLLKGDMVGAKDNSQQTPAIKESTINKLKEHLTDYDKQWMKNAHLQFNKISQDATNEVSMQTKGVPLAITKNYIHIYTDDNFVKTDSKVVKVDATLEGQGRLKSTTSNAPQPLRIFGIEKAVDDNIEDTGRYYAYTIPIRNLRKALNVTLPGGEQSVKKALQDAYGTEVVSRLVRIIDEVETGRAITMNDDEFQSEFGFLYSNYVGATLNGNIRTMLKQFASYPMAGVYINNTNLAKAVFTKVDYDEIDKYSGAHYKRRKGLSHMELEIIRKSNGISELMEKLPTPLNTRKWLEAIDCLVTGKIWNAAKYQAKSEGLTGTEYWNRVIELYEKTLEETQPMYDVQYRTGIQKSNNILAQTLAMFKTDAFQSFGTLYDSLGEMEYYKKEYKKNKNEQNKEEFKKAKQKFYRGAVSSVLNSMYVLTLATLVGDFLMNSTSRWRDDETGEVDILNKLPEVFMANMIGSVLPIIGENIYSMATQNWYDFETPTLAMINDLYASYTKLVNYAAKVRSGEEKLDAVKVYQLADDGIGKISKFAGIEYANVTKIFKSGIYYIGELTGNKQITNFLGYQYKDSQKYLQLYKAIAEGDTEKAAELEQELIDSGKKSTAIDSAIKQQLAKHDERVLEAAVEFNNGNYDKYEELIEDISAEGFKKDIVIGAITSAVNKLKDSDEESAETTYDDSDGLKGTYKKSDLYAAMIAGDKEGYKHINKTLLSEGAEQDKIDSSIKSSLKADYRDGNITLSEAKGYLKNYLGYDDAAVYETECTWQGKGIYEDLGESIKSQDAQSIKYYLELLYNRGAGKSIDALKGGMSSELKGEIIFNYYTGQDASGIVNGLLYAADYIGEDTEKYKETITNWVTRGEVYEDLMYYVANGDIGNAQEEIYYLNVSKEKEPSTILGAIEGVYKPMYSYMKEEGYDTSSLKSVLVKLAVYLGINQSEYENEINSWK